LARPRRRTGLLRRAGLLLALTVGRALLRLARTIVRRASLTRTVVWRAGLLWARTILSGLLAGARRVVALVDTWVGAAEGALLADDLSADGLRRVQLAHETLVALGLLRRDCERHGGARIL